MTERKLAKVVVVDAIKEHKNADALELAVIGGWQCCVKKGEFKAGDVGVYFEVDAMLPIDNPAFAFLAGRNERLVDGKPYARIKTMKLRGELSQGLLLPVDSVGVDSLVAVKDSVTQLVEFADLDMTEALGVIKYEPAQPKVLAGNAKGNFPVFIPKTDQERVQNIKRAYEDAVASGELFEATYKLDGSSFTAYVINVGEHVDDFSPQTGVCSRNLELKIDDSNVDNMFVQTFFKYNLPVKLEKFMLETGRRIAVQGEMVGPGIQNNFEGLDEVELYIYDVFDIDRQEYVSADERVEICKQLDLKMVPVFDSPMRLPQTMEEVLALADGPSGLKGKYREGLVFKSLTRDFSFKVISNKYLIKEA